MSAALREKQKSQDRISSMAGDKIVFGLSKRVWALLGACAGLMLIARIAFPSTPDTSPLGHYTARPGLLTAKDYLNASASDPAPFAFCPVFGPGDAIAQRRGQVGLLKSRLYTGTGARMQRLIQKAMAGQPVTISVLGGSVSACHGAGDDPLSPRCWPSRFFNWWNTIFPHPLSELTNGATRRSDSAYFGYCSSHHMPDRTDLVILEFDASDPKDPEWMNHFELLVRSILVRPDQPAVLLMGHFAPQIIGENGFAGPELLHDIVAQFYDVPHLSVKGMLYSEYMVNPEGTRKDYYTDPVLASPAGHDLMSDIIISYLQGQICSWWSTTMGHAFDVPYMGGQDLTSNNLLGNDADDLEAQGGGLAAQQRAMRVPQARLSDRPSHRLTFREVHPFCAVANDLVNPLPPSLFYGSGWLAHHPKGATTDEESRHYWYAETVGSKIRVPVNVSAGDILIYYLQNPASKSLGRASCWVDDDYANGFELNGIAEVGDTTPTLTRINEKVTPGEHYVECKLLGPEDGMRSAPFKMLGVFAT